MREGFIILVLAGGGSLLVFLDILKPAHTVVNMGVANRYYAPTALGVTGILLFILYVSYLLIRLLIWGVVKARKTV